MTSIWTQPALKVRYDLENSAVILQEKTVTGWNKSLSLPDIEKEEIELIN